MTQHHMCLGMWHRPFERTLDDVIKTLDEMKTLGFSHLFVETFYNGKLIYPSTISLLSMHEWVGLYDQYGRDLLSAFIEEGKKRDIKIHAWVENFFVGRFDTIEETFWYQYKPSWLLKNRDHSYLQKQEVNYVFLDPANDQVSQYLHAIYQESVDMHKGLESLHLDYIRYPLVYDITPPCIHDDVGYTEVAFQKLHQFLTQDIDLYSKQLDDKTYHMWCDFKISIINAFVKEVHNIVHEKTSLSIAIFGDPEHAKKHKMQNWLSWVEHHWIDLIIPMAYYKDDIRVFEEVLKLNEYVKGRAKVFAGIAPSYIGLSIEHNQKQILSSQKAGAEGVVIFASQNYLTKHFMGESHDRDALRELFISMKREGLTK